MMLIAVAVSSVTTAPETVFASTEDEAKITKVENVRQTNATTTSADISWDAYNAAPTEAEDKLQESNYYYEVHIADCDEAGACKENWSKKVSTYDTSTSLYGLETGASYYIRVIAKTIAIPRTTVTQYYDKKMIATTTAQGNTPTVTSLSSNSVSLEWKKTVGADMYQIMGCPTANGEATPLATTSLTNVTIENLHAGTSYLFYVLPLKKGSDGFQTVNSNSYNQVSITTISNAPNKVVLENNWTWEKSMVVSWEQSAADGYEVECSTFNGQHLSVVDTDKTVFEITNFTKNLYQRVRIRAYTKHNDQKYYSNWSGYNYFCKQQKATSIKQKKKKKVWRPQAKVKWNKISGATSYSIYLSKSSQKGYRKITTTKKTSYILKKYNQKKLKTKQRYYVKIVANGYFAGKKIKTFDTNAYRSFKLRENKK